MKGRSSRPKIIYVLLPVIFTALFLIFWMTAGKSVWAYALSQWQTMVIQGAPAYDYEEMLRKDALGYQNGELIRPVRGEQFGKITAEAVDLQAPLYYGDTEEILKSGAGVYMGSYLPGEGGTALIGGHDATFFAPLEQIKTGDMVKVSTLYGEYQYQVTKVQTGEMTDDSLYEIHKDKDEIILYTCYPFGVVDEVRAGRFFVYASRIDDKTNSEESYEKE